MAASDAPLDFDIRTNLRQLLADLKEFDPKLATEVRRRLRTSGESAIAAMRQILEEESGGTLASSARAQDAAGARPAARPRSRGARREVAGGLRLRVTAGKRRTSIRLVSTTGELRMALNRTSWRHPVFDRDEWVEQPGNRYFSRGAWAEAEHLQERLNEAIADALAVLETRSPVID